jgi:hypothetical protein
MLLQTTVMAEEKMKKNLFIWSSVVNAFESQVEQDELGNAGNAYAAAMLAFCAMNRKERAEWIKRLAAGVADKTDGPVVRMALRGLQAEAETAEAAASGARAEIENEATQQSRGKHGPRSSLRRRAN